MKIIKKLFKKAMSGLYTISGTYTEGVVYTDDDFLSYGTCFPDNNANYYNISSLLQKDYSKFKYLSEGWKVEHDKIIHNFIKTNKLKCGDYIFCGTVLPKNQYSGWKIITPDLFYFGEQFAVSLISDSRIRDYLNEHKIKYEKMFNAILNDKEVAEYFFVCEEPDEEDFDMIKDPFVYRDLWN